MSIYLGLDGTTLSLVRSHAERGEIHNGTASKEITAQKPLHYSVFTIASPDFMHCKQEKLLDLKAYIKCYYVKYNMGTTEQPTATDSSNLLTKAAQVRVRTFINDKLDLLIPLHNKIKRRTVKQLSLNDSQNQTVSLKTIKQ